LIRSAAAVMIGWHAQLALEPLPPLALVAPYESTGAYQIS